MKILYAAIVFVFYVLLVRAVGQEAKTVSPISSDEEIALLAAQKEQLVASQALQAAEQKLPEYQKAIDAQKRLQELAMMVFSSRKIDGTQYSLCDGPMLPECKDVPIGRIALRPVPKKFDDATKQPVKK